MLDTAFYLVTAEILQRANLEGQRYKTKDGRYILDNKDLSRVRFTTDEYINGLSGVEKISFETAQHLIAGGGYSTEAPEPQTAEPEPEATAEETVEEPTASLPPEEQTDDEQTAEDQDEEPAPESEEQPSESEEAEGVSEESESETEETNNEEEEQQ